jgi:glyoxylase-like metal-dependent hydrolase (beta-lactamase superfamily II)
MIGDRPHITGTAQHEAWQQRVLPPVEQVRPHVWSIPVPIPRNPLRYTLCYALLDDTGVVVVDPGWDSTPGREAVRAGLAAAGASLADVTGIVVTHIHPDHHGLTGWLREQSGGWAGMHSVEATTMAGRVWRRPPAADRAWLRDHGVPGSDLDALSVDPGEIDGILTMAEPDRLFSDGDRLPLTGHDIRAVWTPGHTPGHLCLHDEQAGILLTGDHLLPRISPTVGVHTPDGGDPLTGYLASLRRTARFRVDEALPAHEYRFRGIDARCAELADHHRHRGQEILDAIGRLGEPSAWAVAAELTWSRGWASLHGLMRRMALGETVAHLHHLATEGLVTSGPDRPARWRARPDGRATAG